MSEAPTTTEDHPDDDTLTVDEQVDEADLDAGVSPDDVPVLTGEDD